MEIINLSLYNAGLSTSIKPKTFLRIREAILPPFCPLEGNHPGLIISGQSSRAKSALHLFE